MLADVLDVLLVEADPLEAELLLGPLRELAEPDRIGVARDGEEALDYLLGRGAYRHRMGGPLPRVVLLELGRYWLRLNRPAPSGAGAAVG